jgi:uncharacterized membrane protein
MTKTSLQPKPDRIIALDVLRGIALLGILLMNIQSFSMIGAAYINPLAFGDLTGANKTVWMLSHALADQKFMSIFSMLFGAGIILFTDNVQKKGFLPLRFFYRRMLWLLVIGLGACLPAVAWRYTCGICSMWSAGLSVPQNEPTGYPGHRFRTVFGAIFQLLVVW